MYRCVPLLLLMLCSLVSGNWLKSDKERDRLLATLSLLFIIISGDTSDDSFAIILFQVYLYGWAGNYMLASQRVL